MDGFPERPAVRAWVTVDSLGPAGLPIFFNVATNRTRPAVLRCAVIDGIVDVFFRAIAAQNFPTNNLPIVPGLLQCLQEPDSDPTVRAAVTNALFRIAPEVVTNGLSHF